MIKKIKYKISLIISILKIAINSPFAFLSQINLDNWKTFRRASENEEKGEILKNTQKLLDATNKDNFQKSLELTHKFINHVKNKYDNTNFIVFVSHEATMTGAPLIILKIAEHLKGKCTPIQILCKGGEIANDFQKNGPTYTLQFFHNNHLLKKELTFIFEELQRIGTINRAYVNSEGSTKLLKFIKAFNIKPVVSLIHEMGSYYPPNSWIHISKYSDHIVFPANAIKQLAIDNSVFDESKINVVGQGLLKEELLTEDMENSKVKIRKELKLRDDSTIILGCGSPIPRKGIDLFILIAISVLNAIDTNILNRVHFVWLGEAPRNEHQIWAARDIAHSAHPKNIHLIGSRKDTIPYFLGSNIFLMTSRGDPFPCVIHEAQASGMPVFAFQNTGGIPEMMNNQYDFLFPYGDIVSMSNKLTSHITTIHNNNYSKEERRSEAFEKLSFKSYVESLQKLM